MHFDFATKVGQSGVIRRDSTVDFIQNLKLIQRATELIGLDTPLRLGQEITLDQIGVCGQLLKNCGTVREALGQFLRYQRLLYQFLKFDMEERDGDVCLLSVPMSPHYREFHRISVELAFSSVAKVLQELTASGALVREYRFSFAEPDDVSGYQKYLKGSLRFDQVIDVVVFESDVINLGIDGGSDFIKELMVEHANQLLAARSPKSDFDEEVRRVIVDNLPKGTATIDEIAAELAMSRWTLNRKLKKTGKTFKGLLNDIRHELAISYVTTTRFTITEIAFLLGYSELGAFSRAFKRWTNQYPSDLRST